jgi:very-short-patch-repair endonuclease
VNERPNKQETAVHQTQRKLRRNMTDAELRLWRYLKGRQMSGFKFRRQHPFDDYVLDFVCLEAMLIIEVDGAQHAHNTISDGRALKISGKPDSKW